MASLKDISRERHSNKKCIQTKTTIALTSYMVVKVDRVHVHINLDLAPMPLRTPASALREQRTAFSTLLPRSVLPPTSCSGPSSRYGSPRAQGCHPGSCGLRGDISPPPHPTPPHPTPPTHPTPTPTQPNPTQPNPTQPNPTQPNPTQPNHQPNPTQPNPTQPNAPNPIPPSPNAPRLTALLMCGSLTVKTPPRGLALSLSLPACAPPPTTPHPPNPPTWRTTSAAKRCFHDTERHCTQNGLRFTAVVFRRARQRIWETLHDTSSPGLLNAPAPPPAAHQATSTSIWLSACLRRFSVTWGVPFSVLRCVRRVATRDVPPSSPSSDRGGQPSWDSDEEEAPGVWMPGLQAPVALAPSRNLVDRLSAFFPCWLASPSRGGRSSSLSFPVSSSTPGSFGPQSVEVELGGISAAEVHRDICLHRVPRRSESCGFRRWKPGGLRLGT